MSRHCLHPPAPEPNAGLSFFDTLRAGPCRSAACASSQLACQLLSHRLVSMSWPSHLRSLRSIHHLPSSGMASSASKLHRLPEGPPPCLCTRHHMSGTAPGSGGAEPNAALAVPPTRNFCRAAYSLGDRCPLYGEAPVPGTQNFFARPLSSSSQHLQLCRSSAALAVPPHAVRFHRAARSLTD